MKHLNNWDIQDNQLLNAKLHFLAKPTSAWKEGKFGYDSSNKRPWWCTDTLANEIYPFATTNTPNTGVLRDGSGGFSAGTISAALAGNATTATTLQTARTLGLSTSRTDASVGAAQLTATAASFNGSANVQIDISMFEVLPGEVMAPAGGDNQLFTAYAGGGKWIQRNQLLLSELGSPNADVDWNGKHIANLADPINPDDAATKSYVDARAAGLDPKASVRLATTAYISGGVFSPTGGTTATGQFTGMPNSLDGVTLATGMRILVKDQGVATPTGAVSAADYAAGSVSGTFKWRVTFVNGYGLETDTGAESGALTLTSRTARLTSIPTGPTGTASRKVYRAASPYTTWLAVGTVNDNVTTQFDDNNGSPSGAPPALNSTFAANGIYVVHSTTTTWMRSDDFKDSLTISPSAFCFVEAGATNADSAWVLASDSFNTINSDPIQWVQFSGAGQILAGNGITKLGNTLHVGSGGVYTQYGLFYATTTTQLATMAVGAQNNVLLAGASGIPAWGQIPLASAAAVSGQLTVPNGGTGQSSLTLNGVLYGNGASAIANTGQGAANTVLWANAGAPTFTGQPTLATGIVTKGQNAVEIDPFNTLAGNTGELRFLELAANGSQYVGFKAPDAIASNKVWVLPASDGAANQYLKTDGSGNLAFAQIQTSQIGGVANLTVGANLSITGGTGSLLASAQISLGAAVVTAVVIDTNITAAIASNTLTLAWSGQLAVARGGTGQSSLAINAILLGNATSALATVRNDSATLKFLAQNNGASSAPTFFDLFNTANTWNAIQTLVSPDLQNPKVSTFKDVNGASILSFTAVTSAVNYLDLQNAANATPDVKLSATGTSTDINIDLVPKGSGRLKSGGKLLPRAFAGDSPASTGAGPYAVTISHNLGTSDVHVFFYEKSSLAVCSTDIEITDPNTVKLWFTSPKASGDFRIIILG